MPWSIACGDQASSLLRRGLRRVWCNTLLLVGSCRVWHTIRGAGVAHLRSSDGRASSRARAAAPLLLLLLRARRAQAGRGLAYSARDTLPPLRAVFLASPRRGLLRARGHASPTYMRLAIATVH